MSMNTRSEIEEERRLFYVALTRAERQVYLSYAQSRYRWGKLIDCEPSRFLEEIDEQYLEDLAPKPVSQPKAFIDRDVFGSPEPGKIRFKKPLQRTPQKKNKRIESKPVSRAASKPSGGNYKKISEVKNVVLADGSGLKTGSIVEHGKFGRGEVVTLDGTGGNQKAEIRFDSGETKKLLLQFAKLKIIE
jgi:DNA helicase-2/ATP-dependent DNA helicase PcrA